MSEPMTSLALAAKRVIDAAWLHGEAYDLSSQAAFALESARLLQSPETAAELGQLRARVAELEALAETASEFRVWEPGYGLYVRRRPGGTGFAILEANRTSRGRRTWTTSGWQYVGMLADSELFCWPDAEAAVAEARRIMPGALPDRVTAMVAPTQALQSLEDPHDGPLAHSYRVGHDLPETGGAL